MNPLHRWPFPKLPLLLPAGGNQRLCHNIACGLMLSLLLLAGSSQAADKEGSKEGPFPEFYGLFAVEHKKTLVQVKQGQVPSFSTDVELLLFDKRVVLAADETFYRIGFDTEPHPADDGSFSWDKLDRQMADYGRAMAAALNRIPEGAVPVETLRKPVAEQSEMIRFVPATPFKPGLYQLGNLARFWVERDNYIAEVAANARKSLEAGQWLEASRFASIALVVAPSDARLVEEMTQIKFGALTTGATKALQQGAFESAESLAKRGNELQPPPQFASEFRLLADREIPYQKAVKLASDATRDEVWDVVMQASEMALRLKPNDPKAEGLQMACPKKLLPVRETFSGVVENVNTYNLRFAPDSKRVSAVVQAVDSNGHREAPKLHAWDVESRQEVALRHYLPSTYSSSPKEDLIAWSSGVADREFNLFLDTFFGTPKPRQVFGEYPFQPNVDRYGFDETGSILWTVVRGFSEKNMEQYGLLATAKELRLLETSLFQSSLKPSVMLWDLATLRPITVLGFPDHQGIESVCANDQMVAMLDHPPSSGDAKTPNSRLSVWGIRKHNLLAKVEEAHSDLSVWGFGADGKRVIVWLRGKFWLWNWQTKEYESPLELPTQGTHIATFSENRKCLVERASSDPYIRIIEWESGKILCKFKEAPGVNVTAMAVSPDGSQLAVCLNRKRDPIGLWKIPDPVKVIIAEKRKARSGPLTLVNEDEDKTLEQRPQMKEEPVPQEEEPKQNRTGSQRKTEMVAVIGVDIQKNLAWPVIQRAIDAVGGVERVMRVNVTRTRITGKSQTVSGDWVRFECTAYYKYPEQTREEAVVRLKTGPLRQILVYSGGVACGSQNGLSFTVPEYLKETLRREAFLQTAETLRPLLEGKYHATLNDEVNIDGKRFASVSVSSAGNLNGTLLFDPGTGLLARRRYTKRDPKGGTVSVEAIYSDWRTRSDGTKKAGHVLIYENGKIRFESQLIDSTVVNDMPDDCYRDPSLPVRLSSEAR